MKEFKFYGVCENCYKLGDTVWEAIEDPSDGYRSYLASIEYKNDGHNLTFFPDPIATVVIHQENNEVFDGYEFVDVEDGHIWLEVGTNRHNDYYPSFYFAYHPKPPKPVWEDFIKEGE